MKKKLTSKWRFNQTPFRGQFIAIAFKPLGMAKVNDKQTHVGY